MDEFIFAFLEGVEWIGRRVWPFSWYWSIVDLRTYNEEIYSDLLDARKEPNELKKIIKADGMAQHADYLWNALDKISLLDDGVEMAKIARETLSVIPNVRIKPRKEFLK